MLTVDKLMLLICWMATEGGIHVSQLLNTFTETFHWASIKQLEKAVHHLTTSHNVLVDEGRYLPATKFLEVFEDATSLYTWVPLGAARFLQSSARTIKQLTGVLVYLKNKPRPSALFQQLVFTSCEDKDHCRRVLIPVISQFMQRQYCLQTYRSMKPIVLEQPEMMCLENDIF